MVSHIVYIKLTLDLHSTAGCHPTSTTEIDSFKGGEEAYFSELETLISEDRGEGGSKRIVSIGEVGLGGYLVRKH